MTWNKSIHVKYGCGHTRSNITAHNRDTRLMTPNINYRWQPRMCGRVEAMGGTPTNHAHSVRPWVHGKSSCGTCFLNPSYSQHPRGVCGYRGLAILSAWYRRVPGWTGRDVSLNPASSCYSFYLFLSSQKSGMTRVNIVTDAIDTQATHMKPGCRYQWFRFPFMELV